MRVHHPHRIYLPGTSVHVIQRGVNHAEIFNDNADYERLLQLGRKYCSQCGVLVHGFVLMTTHFHLIVTPGDRNALPSAMQRLGASYVRYFNRRHDRIGALWNGRYRALHVLDERYWLTCLRYIEQNPVRAQMVRDPGEYRWSSYGAHALGQSLDWLTPHDLYTRLGPTPEARQWIYRALCASPLAEADLAWQRRSTPLAAAEASP